jgi:5-methylcytosine-specific restriction endonuclease McrA
MNNIRMSVKERNLVKGALRRVFSRSDLRRAALAKAIISHIDESRPRVKKWGFCPTCKQPTALYQMEVDHIIPIIPIGRSLDEMSWDEVMDRLWCPIENLIAICKPCHKAKTKIESKLRREAKNDRRK